MERIEIGYNEPLNPGDLVELHYTAIGGVWIKAAQISMIEKRLENQKNFRIENADYWTPGKVVFRVRVLAPNPILVTIAVISAAIIGVGIVLNLLLEKWYKIQESPAGKIMVGGIGTMALAAGITALLAILSKGK